MGHEEAEKAVEKILLNCRNDALVSSLRSFRTSKPPPDRVTFLSIIHFPSILGLGILAGSIHFSRFWRIDGWPNPTAQSKKPITANVLPTPRAAEPSVARFALDPLRRTLPVPKKELIIDFSEYDLNKVVADIEEIRRYNPQRFEMEQLTAICHEDEKNNICVGYKDLGLNEFWVRGHMPGMPLMPGVIMCEAAAQLSSYYSHRYNLMTGVIGFGGLEDVRFRGVVRPGDRFVIVCRLLKLRRSIMTCEFQCFVNQGLVCEGVLKGVSLSQDAITGEQPE
jgi:3-hydroxyacyl-[acyl-carrier-protein] dehydratase